MKKTFTIIVVFLFFLLTNTIVTKGESTEKESINMYVNTTKKLTFCESVKNVKWSVSNDRIEIVDMNGENDESVVLLTRHDSGNCIVKATDGTNTRIWKVKIKGKRGISRVSIKKVVLNKKKTTITLRCINRKQKHLEYGYYWKIQKLEDGKWIKVCENESWDDVACTIPKHKSIKRKITINNRVLDSGVYRVIVDLSVKKQFRKDYFVIK